MSELKPLECPCCHRPPTIMPNRIGDFYAICYTNEPDEMACGMSTSDQRCETERGAVERWNKFVTAALTKGARIGLEMAAKIGEGRLDELDQDWFLPKLRSIPDSDIMKEISRE